MRDILLRGYFGHGNWGDEILLRGLVTGLTANGLPAGRLHHWRGDSPAFQPPAIGHSVPRGWPGMTQWLKAGAMIFSGGIFYDHLSCFGLRRLRRIRNMVKITRAFGKKVMLFGVGIGPLTTPAGYHLTRNILQAADGIWVRDPHSCQFCKTIGLHARQIPDLCAALVSTIAAMPRPPLRPEVLFIPCQTGPSAKAQFDLLGALKPVVSRHQLALRVMPLHLRDDIDLTGELCRQYGLVPVQETLADPLRMFTRIMAARLVVSVRLHGGWAAYLTGRPFLQINYHPKCRGMAETIGLPGPYLIDPAGEAAELGRRADQLLTGQTGVCAELTPRYVLEKRIMQAFRDLSRQLIQ